VSRDPASPPRIARLAALGGSAAACILIALAGSFPRPYPILTDLDSSFVAFLAMADERGWRAGIDFVFTYGPLGAWFMPIGVGDHLLGAAVLRMASAAALVGYIWRAAPDVRGAVLAVGALFLVAMDTNAALLAVTLVLAFALPRGNLAFLVSLAVLSACWGLVKFSGVVAFGLALLIYAAAAVVLERCERRRVLYRALAVAGTYAATIAVIYAGVLGQPVGNFLQYAGWSMEIATGYSQYMAIGRRHELMFGFVALVGAAIVLHAWTVARDSRLAGRNADPQRPAALPGSLLPLLCAMPVLLVTWKQGFTRQDGHEATAFVVAFVYLSLVLAGTRVPGRVLVPGHAVLAVLVAALVMAIRGNVTGLDFEALARRLAILPGRLADAVELFSPQGRAETARHVDRRDREAVRQLQLSVPILAGYRSFDLFAPEQALALVNPQAYRPRPVFQGYSAYTAALQDLNAAHVARVPQEFLVDIRPIDGRYPNLEDGSALAQIMLQFCPEAWYGSRAGFRRSDTPVAMATIDALDWTSARLDRGGRIDLPAGVVLGRVDIGLSVLGKALAAAYRMPPIEATVSLSDGSERVVRLIPTGRRYPVVLSPWLENAADIRALWTGDGGGRAVLAVRLETSGRTRMLVEDVTLSQAALPWQPIADRCVVPAAAEPVALSSAFAYSFPGRGGDIRLASVGGAARAGGFP